MVMKKALSYKSRVTQKCCSILWVSHAALAVRVAGLHAASECFQALLPMLMHFGVAHL